MSELRNKHTGLAKVAVQCSADTFVVNQSLVLRINICAENRHCAKPENVMGKAIIFASDNQEQTIEK